MISSGNNTQIKELVKLQSNAKFRKKMGCFVAEGRKLAAEAAACGNLTKIYIEHSLYQKLWHGQSEAEISGEFANAAVEIVSDSVFGKACKTMTPQGILAVVKMPEYTLDGILSDGKGYYLLLDDLRDPGNLGTILRTSEGAGISGVILSSGSVDLFNPKTVRSTMGSIFRVPFVYVDDMTQTIQKMKHSGIAVLGCCLDGSVPYDLVDYRGQTGIVIGNEANGISLPVQEALSNRIHIPMKGQLESLNAAVSAAIVMYEAARQRRE